MEMTEGISTGAGHGVERRYRVPVDRDVAQSAVRTVLSCLGIGAAGVVASSASARAHEVDHAVVDHGDATASFLIVLGLPVFAGLFGGVVAARCRSPKPSAAATRRAPLAVGLLLVSLGMASLLSTTGGHRWVAAAGVTIGAGTALWFENGASDGGADCGTHDDLALGAISTHRLLEGVIVGTLFATGAVLGLVGAIALAGHAALETAAVGGLYGGALTRIRVVGAIVVVQASYVVGVVAGLSVLGPVPVSARSFVLAVVGGLLLVVGAVETERSFTADRRPARSG